MSDHSLETGRPTDPVGRFLLIVTRVLAVLGGLFLAGTAFVTIYSIVLLQFLNSSFPGDVELVSYGLVLSVFLFLPYSQMVRGHVIVDIFTMRASNRTKGRLDAMGALIFAILAVLLVWRMSVGGIEMYDRHQTTAWFNIPHWWAFPVAVFCLAVLALVSLYTGWQSLRGQEDTPWDR